jgi:hypothetical protein
VPISRQVDVRPEPGVIAIVIGTALVVLDPVTILRAD